MKDDEALAEFPNLFPLLAENVSNGIVIMDRAMRIQYINPKHAASNHLSVDAHIGQYVRDILPSAYAVIEPKVRFVFDTGVPLLNQEVVAKFPSPDGSLLHRIASYYPYRDGAGTVTAVVGIVRDLLVDELASQLLEDSQHRLLNVLDNLFTFVGVLEIDGTLVHANRAPLDAADITLPDVRGKLFWDCDWWSYDSAVQQQLKQAIGLCREGAVVRYDVQVRMRDDSRMWIDFMLAPLRDQHGLISHLIPSGIDISQRHAGEAALHRSEERYRSIVESSDDAIIIESLGGTITGWNPAATRLFGYARDEALGQLNTILFPAELQDEQQRMTGDVLRGQRVPTFDTTRRHKDGTLLDVALTISPLRDQAGRVVGACLLARDISVQKHQLVQIEHALVEKTALLHEVHHRVKNNLQVVSSLLKLQARKETSDAARALAQCQGRIRAMALVHQLLYQSDSVTKVDLADYLARLVALSDSSYDVIGNGITMTFRGADAAVAIDIQHAVPCGMLVHELVVNAIKHAFTGHHGGSIVVELERGADGLLRIAVSDDGCGLPVHFSWGASAGLGGQLIPMFAAQLHARLTTTSAATGSCFTIEFQHDGGSEHAT